MTESKIRGFKTNVSMLWEVYDPDIRINTELFEVVTRPFNTTEDLEDETDE